MSKTEIMAELTHLTPEELADVRNRLDQLMSGRTNLHSTPAALPPPRISSPRLADPTRAKDFVKQVVEMPANASL